MRRYHWVLVGEAVGLVAAVAFFFSARPLDYCYYEGPVLLVAVSYLVILLPLAVVVQAVAAAATRRDWALALALGLLSVAAAVIVFEAPRDHAVPGGGTVLPGWVENPYYPGCTMWKWD